MDAHDTVSLYFAPCDACGPRYVVAPSAPALCDCGQRVALASLEPPHRVPRSILRKLGIKSADGLRFVHNNQPLTW